MSATGLLQKLDAFQQRHRATAFGYAVVKKYGEDRGSSLAALMTYYGFLSLFPLLLVFFTVTFYALANDAHLRKQLTDSLLGQFPVIGDQLRQTDKPLHGSPVALIVGFAGLIWGALGVSQALQEAMLDVWGVPRGKRPGFLSRVGRGVLLFVVLGAGVAGTTFVASLGTALDWGPFGSLLAALPAALANIGLFWVVFRLLSPRDVPGGALLAGAAVGGVGWQILQTVGINLVSHQLRHASQLYGVFAFTLALLSFLSLASQLTVYSAEINVVRHRHVWPRSLLEKPEVAEGGDGGGGRTDRSESNREPPASDARDGSRPPAPLPARPWAQRTDAPGP